MDAQTDLWEIERQCFAEGYALVCGVDEAGRGPLAGPVYAAAVILPPELVINGLNDSKKLTEKRREQLFPQIQAQAVAWGIGSASPQEIDQLNILNATYLAMNRAIAQIKPVPDLCLIDGNRSAGIQYPSRCFVKGDSRSASIAAASILAKVTRDRYMVEQDALYPGYGFAQHKGYGTKQHYAAIRELGPCPIHRQSFLKKLH